MQIFKKKVIINEHKIILKERTSFDECFDHIYHNFFYSRVIVQDKTHEVRLKLRHFIFTFYARQTIRRSDTNTERYFNIIKKKKERRKK